jgi:hypothetical protein
MLFAVGESQQDVKHGWSQRQERLGFALFGQAVTSRLFV